MFVYHKGTTFSEKLLFFLLYLMVGNFRMVIYGETKNCSKEYFML